MATGYCWKHAGMFFHYLQKNGAIKDITQTTGTAERYPAWSPDGASIAYWSDESGEYELWLASLLHQLLRESSAITVEVSGIIYSGHPTVKAGLH